MKLINERLTSSVHDVSAGGLLLALVEMTFDSNYGLKIDKPKNLSNLMEYYFSEDQGRYLIEVDPNNLNKINKILVENNIYSEVVATVQKDYFEVSGELKILKNELCKINKKWYSNY